MAVTVTPNLTDLVDCDIISGSPVAGTFSASQGSPAVVTDIYREATGSIGCELRSAGVQWMKFTRTSGTWDLSNTHIYIWFMNLFFNSLATKVNGGIRILVGDGTNVGYWYVAGSDTYSGGWICLVVDTSKLLDSGSCTLTAVTEIGVGVNYVSAVRNVESTYMDIARYGDGLTVTSDAVCTLQDIFDYSSADLDGRAHGIIRKEGGVFFLQGKLRLGDASSGSIEFEDTSQVIVFEDKDVNADLYEILVQGNAAGTTSIKFGAKSGGRGISGCVVRSEGTPKYDITAIDTDIDTLGLYGCIFYDADNIQLPPNSANREALDCTFEKCGQVVPDTCKVQYCNFVSSDADAVLISDDPHYVTDCNFISCVNGVEIDTYGDGEYDFVNLQFSGCAYDVNNSCGQTLTVANSGSNASSYTGSTVNFITSVQLTIKVTNEAGEPIIGAFAYIDNDDQTPYIMNTTTDDEGEATVPYSGSPVTDARWRVRKYGYKNFKQLIDIAGDDINLPVTLVVDPQQT